MIENIDPKVFDALKEAKKTLVHDYQASVKQSFIELMNMQYLRLGFATQGFENIRDKKILDIACGARGDVTSRDPSAERRNPSGYEPWFARFAKAMGAKEVVGMDRRKSGPENYTHLQTDLFANDPADPNNLSHIPAESFDIVNTCGFVSGPEQEGVDLTDDSVAWKRSRQELTDLEKRIIAEATRIVKEGGYFLHNETVRQKINGVLQEIPRTEWLKYGFLLPTNVPIN